MFVSDVTIGFRPVQYTVNENAGTVTLFVHVLDGELARAVEVDFITEDGTATSSSPIDYNAPGVPITLQFTPDDLVAEVTITIENDDIIENAETFAGVLSTLDGAVYLAPERASVEITDDDGKHVVIIRKIVFNHNEYTICRGSCWIRSHNL